MSKALRVTVAPGSVWEVPIPADATLAILRGMAWAEIAPEQPLPPCTDAAGNRVQWPHIKAQIVEYDDVGRG